MMNHHLKKKLLLFVFTSIFFACTFALAQNVFADSLSAAGTGTSSVVTGRKIVDFKIVRNNAMALDNKGNVWTWGYNGYGYNSIPANGSNTNRPLRQLSGAQGNGVYLHDIVEIAGGSGDRYDNGDSGAAKDINGNWYSWGFFDYAKTGAANSYPKRVAIPSRTYPSGDPIPVKQIAFGAYANAYLVYEDNTLYSAGTNNYGQLMRDVGTSGRDADYTFQASMYPDNSIIENAGFVSDGGSEMMNFVDVDGKVFQSGYTVNGTSVRGEPVYTDEIIGYSDPPANTKPIYKQLDDIRLASAGSTGDGSPSSNNAGSLYAVDNQNRIWTWGYLGTGLPLGLDASGNIQEKEEHAKLASIASNSPALGNIIQIDANLTGSAFVDNLGHVYAVGSNTSKNLINDSAITSLSSYTPLTFDGSIYSGTQDDHKLIQDAIQVHIGNSKIFYLNENGLLYRRGSGSYGIFGGGIDTQTITGAFEPIVFPTQPTVYADKLDSAGNAMTDDPATPIDEGTYRNQYYKDPDKKVDDLRYVDGNDRYNKGLRLHVDRDRADNGDAADFGAIYMQSCELELDADGNEVFDGNGRVVCDRNGWSNPVKVKDDDGSDYVFDVTFEHSYDTRIFRKYRFYYEGQVNMNYDPTSPDAIQDMYTDFVVDLKRGDIDVLVDELENGTVIRSDLVLQSGNVYTNFINLKVGKHITTDIYMEDCSSGTCTMQLSQRGITRETIAINRIGTYRFEMVDDYGNKTVFSNVKVYRDHTRPNITAFKIFDLTKPDPDIAADYTAVQYVSGSGAIQSVQHAWVNDHLTFTIEGNDSPLDSSGIEYLNLYQLNATGDRIGAPLWRYKIASTPTNPITNVDLTLPTFAGNHFNISENGTYEIEIVDYAGNSSVDPNRNSAVKFKIDCIDKQAPVLENVASPTTQINGANQLELQIDVSDTQSLVDTIDYQIVSNGSAPTASGWQSYTAATWLSIPNNFNGRVYVRAKDHAGNQMGDITSAPYDDMQFYTIVNDRNAPTIAYLPYVSGNTSGSDDLTAWISRDFEAKIQVEDAESGIEKIEIVNTLLPSASIVYTLTASESAQSKQAGGITLTVPIPDNGIYHVDAYDFGGNVTTAMIDSTQATLQDQQKLIIDHIDKDAPVVSGITLNAAGELMIATNNDGTGSGLRVDPTTGNMDGIEYRVDGRDPWIVYDVANPPVIPLGVTGTFVEVRATDQVGLVGTLSITLSATGGSGDTIAPSFGTVHNATSSTWRRGANGGTRIQVDVSDNTGGSGVSTIKAEPIAGSGASLVDENGFSVPSYTQSFPASASDQFTFYAATNGDYKLTMSDVAGNRKTITITADHVDNELPSGTIHIGTRNIISTMFGNTKHYFNLQNVQDCANAQVSCAGIGSVAGIDDIEYQFVKTGDPILPGNWQSAAIGTNYDIDDDFTGYLYVAIRDAALLDGVTGTKGNELLLQTYISGDGEAPKISSGTSIQGNQPPLWVNTPVQVSMDISDNLSGIYEVKLAAKNGSASIMDAAGIYQSHYEQIEPTDGITQKVYTFTINRVGDYEATFTDYAGNVSRKETFTVTNVDMDPPTIEPIHYVRKANGSADVTLQSEDGNGSGIQDIYYITSPTQITTPLGTPLTNASWQTYTNNRLNTSDAFLYVIALDQAGNFSTVVERHLNDDFTAPNLHTPITSPATWVNGTPSLTFQVEDQESGIKKVIVRDANNRLIQTFTEPTPYVGIQTYTIQLQKSDTYTVEMWDDEGNSDTTTMNVTNIDNEKPLIQDIRMIDSSLIPPLFPSSTLDASIRAVDAPAGNNSGIKEYRYVFVPNGIALPPLTNWTLYDPVNDPDPSCAKTFVGELHMIAYDHAGNASDEFIKVIGASISQDAQGPLFQIIQAGPQNWQKQGSNSVIQIKVSDTSDIQSIALIDDPSGIANCTSVAGAAGSNEMSMTCQIDRNGSYLFEAVDKLGNRSERAVAVRKYDNNAPEVTQMDTFYANGSLHITLDGDDHGESGLADLYYQIVPANQNITASWIQYTPSSAGSVQIPMQADFKGSLAVKAIDAVGNASNPVYKLLTTDSDKPTIQIGTQVLASDRHSAQFSINVKDSISGVQYYTISGPGVNQGYVAVPAGSANDYTANTTVTKNGQYFVRAYDYAGNASDIGVFVASNIEELGSSGASSSIDIQIIRGNPASQWYTAGSLIPIEISGKDAIHGIKSMEIIDHIHALQNYAPLSQNNPTDLSTQYLRFDVSENGLYTVKVTNQNGDYELRTLYIDRFDLEGPQIGRTIQTAVSNGDLTISMQVVDTKSGVDKIYYQLLPNGSSLTSTWLPYDPNVPISVGSSFDGQLVLKAKDKAGNDSEIIYENLKVENGTKVPSSPTTSAITIDIQKGDPTRWYAKQDHISVSIGAEDVQYGILSIEMIDDISGVSNYTKLINGNAADKSKQTLSFEVTKNGLYTVKVTSQDGTSEIRQFIIDRYDLSGPIIKEDTSGSIQGTALRVDTDAVDQESGVKEFQYQFIGADGTVNGWRVFDPSQSIPLPAGYSGRLQVRALDQVGNASTIKTIYIEDGEIITVPEDPVLPAPKPPKPDEPSAKDEYLKQCENGKPIQVNVDTDGDGIPDLNLDPEESGVPVLNVDFDCDAIPDLNIDTDGDGKADLNIDRGDGIAYMNIVKLSSWEPNVTYTLDNGFSYNTMKDITPTQNIDLDGDGVPDQNLSDVDVSTGKSNGSLPDDVSNRALVPALGESLKTYWWYYLLALFMAVSCLYRLYQRYQAQKQAQKNRK